MTSKKAAAQRVSATLDPRWHTLIESSVRYEAAAVSAAPAYSHAVAETLAFIRLFPFRTVGALRPLLRTNVPALTFRAFAEALRCPGPHACRRSESPINGFFFWLFIKLRM